MTYSYRFWPLLFLVIGVLVASESSRAAENVFISEFMALNRATLADEDGQFSDWIEIYNPTEKTVNLDGWYMTDDQLKLMKWRFPSTNLPPFSYLTVFASGKNRAVPGAPLHTSFNLNGAGEYLGLVKPDGITISSEFAPAFPPQFTDLSFGVQMSAGPANLLIGAESVAKVLVPATDVDENWTAAADYDDSLWRAAAATVGFDSGTNYHSSFEFDLSDLMWNNNSSVFLRIPFSNVRPDDIQELKLRVRYDDGFVAYLNGTEIARRNAPEVLRWDSSATTAHGSSSAPGVTQQQDFASGTDSFATAVYGGGPGPQIVAGLIDVIPPQIGELRGQFLRLLHDGISNQVNSLAFPQPSGEAYDNIVAEFDFRMSDVFNNPAEGFSFMLIPTATYGPSGEGVPPAGRNFEEPVFPGVFAVAFDVSPHPAQNALSVYWNGVRLKEAAVPLGALDLVSGRFHRATIILCCVEGGAQLRVALTPNIYLGANPPIVVIDDIFVPGMKRYSSRVQFGARSGASTMNLDLDNVHVEFEPAAGLPAYEEFDISSAIPSLVEGTNILAIQGLNLSRSDPDFLLIPELVARSILVQTNWTVLSNASPGGPNTYGEAASANAPTFSVAGGLYTNQLLAIELSTGSNDAVAHYTLDGSVPSISSPVYVPGAPLVVAQSAVIRARVFQPGMLPSPVVSETYTLVDNSAQDFSSNLPLVIIDSFGNSGWATASGIEAPVSMAFIDTFRGRSGLQQPVQALVRARIEVRGSSSTNYPKKSFAFEVQDETGRDRDVSLLGLPAESDWVLYAPYADKTFMNDVLAFELHEKMGHYAVRRRYVEVFLNTAGGRLTSANYVGIYVLLEKIKIGKNRVDIAQLTTADNTEPNISGGYILKKDRLGPNDTPIVTTGGNGFSPQVLGIVEPKADQITAPQKTWINDYLNNFEAALYANDFTNGAYADFVDIDSFVDQCWIVEFPKNIDGYRLSNFMRKDRDKKLDMEPIWDWDLSFGNANYGSGQFTNGWYFSPDIISENQHIWLRRLLQDSNFVQRVVDRWGELREGVFVPASVLARMDQIATNLAEAQARDFARWPRLGTYVWPNPSSYYPITTYTGTVAWAKEWVSGRFHWLDDQFLKRPLFGRPRGQLFVGNQLTITAPSGSILFTLDGSDPRASGGGISARAQTYTSSIEIVSNVHVVARAYLNGAWSPPRKAIYYTKLLPLVISEVMYHPAAPSDGSDFQQEDYEFIELKNTGDELVDLTGVRIKGGVDFVFTNGWLAPGRHIVVTRNANAFRERYGMGIPIAGEYSGYLANEGEKVQIEGAVGEKIFSLDYDPSWFPICNGLGFSLVPRGDSGWRTSAAVGGSPGSDDPEPSTLAAVKVNEFSPADGKIELFGPGGTDLSGWFLTTRFEDPKQVRLAVGTVIPPSGYLVVSVPELRGALGQIYLFSGDSQANLTGYFHRLSFDAVLPGASMGLQTTSDGREFAELQAAPTFGTRNIGAEESPLIISEIMYHPPDVFTNGAYWDNTEHEYIEIFNRSDQPVSFSGWELRGTANFAFASNTVLNPKSYLLVVSFDTSKSSANFRARYSLPNNLPIIGPYTPGKLPNSEGLIHLVQWRDGIPVVMDSAYYSDAVPRLKSADGFGNSLQRRVIPTSGRDIVSWIGTLPNPGSEYIVAGDTDLDGMPDEWERLNGFDETDPLDAALDSDHDGMTNLQEYLAGTHPRDPSRYLRIERFSVSGLVRLEFTAESEKTYTVQFTEDFKTGSWRALADVPADGETRSVEVIDADPAPQRFYRIVTPALSN